MNHSLTARITAGLLAMLMLVTCAACQTNEAKKETNVPEPSSIIWMEGGPNGTPHVYQPGDPAFEAIAAEVTACLEAARTEDGTYPTAAARPGEDYATRNQIRVIFSEQEGQSFSQLTFYNADSFLADTGGKSLYVPLSANLMAILANGPEE